MRILLTNVIPPGSGSSVVIEAVANELEKLGHQVKIFFPDNQYLPDLINNQRQERYKVWKFPIKKNGIQINTFPLIRPDPHPHNTSGFTFKHLSKQQLELYVAKLEEKIKNLIQEFKPHIIECHHIWLLGYVLHNLKIPFISVAHNTDQNGFYYDKRMQSFAKQSAKNSQLIFAVSEKVRNRVIDLYQVNPARVITLNNGYKKEIFKPKKLDKKKILKQLGLSIPNDAFIVVFIGKISNSKGVDLILKANKLLNGGESKIHFILCGAGHEEWIKSNKNSPHFSFEHVHFLGHQSEVIISQLLNISKLSVLPSRSEGFSIACLEAMGCGKPVVVTKSSNMGKVIVGDVFASNNPQQLLNSINKILNLPTKEYRILSQLALLQVNKYSWEQLIQQRIACYQQISRGRTRIMEKLAL